MINIKWMYLTTALFTMIINGSVFAHGGYVGGYYGNKHSYLNLGINLGGYYGPYYGYGGYYGRGFYGYPFYYPPYYIYPPTVIVPTIPPVYIQKEKAQPIQPQTETNYWFYCKNPEGYYPYIKNCPGGWLQVAPRPPRQ